MDKEEKMLVEYETEHGTVKLSPGIIRKYLTNGDGTVTDEEVVMFTNLCRYQQLNPFLKEAYLIKYSANSPATMVVSKDAFLKRAEKHPQYDGCKAGVYVQKEKKLEKRIGTLFLNGETLVGGWAEVYRKDWTHPTEISVSYREYEGKKSDGTANFQWARMPATMIRKVALAQALREAFTDEFQGMYDSSEISDEAPVYDIGNYEIEPEKPEKKQEKTAEYKKLEAQIMKDINDPLFTGTVMLDGKEADLEYYKQEIPAKLKEKIFTMGQLQHSADTVGQMLLAASEQSKEAKDE